MTRQVQAKIRQLDNAGVPGREIARWLNVSGDSVAKYPNLEDCSPTRTSRTAPRSLSAPSGIYEPV